MNEIIVAFDLREAVGEILEFDFGCDTTLIFFINVRE